MSHRVIEERMGEQVEALEDLLRKNLRAVCVGINPSPVSVQAGHYYQGRLGQSFFRRLERAGVLPPGAGFEDDRAFAAEIGFTDIIKRPSARANELGAAESDHGSELLLEKLERFAPRLVIFTFKKTATTLLGTFSGHGLLDQPVAGIPAFVMPGPYERANVVTEGLAQLVAAMSRP